MLSSAFRPKTAATPSVSRLIDLGERSPEVLYNTGLMYEKAGQLDKAVRLYRDALAQQPDMPEALLNLGRILESSGKSDEARQCWTKALEAEPAIFKLWQPRTVTARLKSYGIPAARKIGSRREFRDVTPEVLRRIQASYGIDLDFPEAAGETNTV